MNDSMNKDFSLIDANLARAREGVRTLEDIARFILKNEKFFLSLRSVRHQIDKVEAGFGAANTISGRQGIDIGKNSAADLAPHYKTSRQSLLSLVRANANRSTQAFRVVEEFAKLYDVNLAHKIESLRYELYTLEYRLLTKLPQYWLNVYFERGVVYPLVAEAGEAIWFFERGARVVQLRDKAGDRGQTSKKAEAICKYLFSEQKNRPGTEPGLLIINDYPEIVTRLPVAGVHLGQNDGDLRRARKIVGSIKIIGRSTHSLEDAAVAAAEGADYIGVGPVFSTPIKSEKKPLGVARAQEIVKSVSVLAVAIGGITKNNAFDLERAGIYNVAAIRSAKEFFSA